MIRLSHVRVSPETAERVKEMALAGRIGQGPEIEEFEQAFARWLGVRHCVAVGSGTLADTIALAVLKRLNPERTEVVMPALTFAAQLNAVLYNGLTPVFVDAFATLYPDKVFEVLSKKTLCVFGVHLLGQPFLDDPKSFLEMCRSQGVAVVEDACEALGSEVYVSGQGFVKCGALGEMGTFSFFPSHTMSTGEGGMIATNSAVCADLARRLRNHGKVDGDTFHFDMVGFNGKMTAIEAALGLGALAELDQMVEQRRASYFALGGREDATREKICPHAFPWLCEDEEKRDALLQALRGAAVECRNLFSCLPTQEPAYGFLKTEGQAFPLAEDIGRRGLYVPCHGGLSSEEILRMRLVLNRGGGIPLAAV